MRSTSRRLLLWVIPALIGVALIQTGAVADTPLGWSWDQVSIRPTPLGEAECAVDGATFRYAKPGEPDLPAVLVQIRAPERSSPESYEIFGSVTSDRNLDLPIAPCPEDHPTEQGGPVHVAPLQSAYQAASYPAERVRFLGISSKRGTAWASFAVYPVTLERGHKLILLEEGTLTVRWKSDPSIPAPLKSLRPESYLQRDLSSPQTISEEGSAQLASDRPSLSGSAVRYVVIAPAAFSDSLQAFVAWKNQTGTRTVLRTVEWIYQNYPGGVDHQEQIRNFLRDAYLYWGSQYLLIVGGTEQVPIRTAKYLSWNYPAGMDIITDYYYACLEGTWNADGDAVFGEPKRTPGGVGDPGNPVGDDVDFSPELIVGRIPVTSVEQVHNWLTKYWKYVKSPDLGGYLQKALFMGEVLFNADWSRALLPHCGSLPCPADCGGICVDGDGADDCVDVIGILDASGVHLNYTELYEWYEYWQAHGRPNAQLELKSTVIADLTSGAGWIQHVGHGNFDRISVGSDDGITSQARILSSDVLSSVRNAGKPGILYSINCTSAAINADCIAAMFLSSPNGGEVCYVGSSNLDFPSTARPYEEGFWRKVFTLKQSPGEAFSDNLDENSRDIGNDENYRRFLTFSLIFLGDPQMKGWLGTPSTLAVTGPTQMSLSDSTFSVTVTRGGNALQGALVTAYKAGDVYGVATTGADGVAAVPFRPTSTGSFTVWVTEAASVPKQLLPAPTVVVPGGTGSSVLAAGLTVVDGTGGRAGTTGNANGRFEAGETVDLDLTVKNVGNAAASNVLFTLSADSMASRLEIVDGSYTATTIAANSTVNLVGAFRVRVPAVPADTTVVKPDSLLNRDRLAYDTNVVVHDGSRNRAFSLPLYAYRPDFRILSVDMHNTGDAADSIPSNGETWLWKPQFRNIGTGSMANLRASLSAISGAFVDTDTASFEGPIEQGNDVSLVHPFEFRVDDQASLKLSLSVYSTIQQPDTFFKRTIQFGRPLPPAFFADTSGAPLRLQTSKDAIVVVWQKSPSKDIEGYILKRATAQGGPYLPVTGDLLTRMEYYRDQGLAGLTRYYYKVGAVDHSGNQSLDSGVISSTTSPATLPGWPVELNDVGYGCPTIENIDVGHETTGHINEIFLNTDVMYAYHSDGTEVIDGDQLSTTNGVWSINGGSFWGKPAIGDINNDGIQEIVATSRKDMVGGINGGHVFVWDRTGRLLWQASAGTPNLLCSPVIANIDSDPNSEILVQNDGAIYAWNHDGTPVIPGNANGLLIQVGNDPFTYGSLAVANLEDDPTGREDIIYAYGASSGAVSKLSVIKFNGTTASILNTINIEGAGPCNVSPAVLRTSDGTYEIFVNTRFHIAGYRWVQSTSSLQQMWNPVFNGGLPGGASRPYDSSIAIGNITGNTGEYDIVASGGSGKIYAINAQTGVTLSGFPYRPGGSDAKLSSPLLVDMDNDTTQAEIVVGDDSGTVYAFRGTAGHAGEWLPGFPFVTGGSIVNGLAYWDVDNDGHPDLLIQANALPSVTTLQLTNVDFPHTLKGRMDADPWTSFRHDARNTGLITTDVVTPVATMEAEGSAETGVAVIRWDAPMRPETFRVQRSGLEGTWTTRQEGPASLFQQSQGYEYRDASTPGSYSYRVIGLDGAGSVVLQSQEVHVTVLPVRLRLIGAVPNPFNPRTMIRYESPEGKIQLDVIDLSGRLVRTLFDGPVQPGTHDVEWNGKNNAGRDVGSGIYLARLRGIGGMKSQKIVLLR